MTGREIDRPGAGTPLPREATPLSRRDFVLAAALGPAGAGLLSARRQGQRLVVDGLDTSVVNDGFLDVVRTGGAHCVHKTLYGMDSFEALRDFVEARPDRGAIATSVRDIRSAHRAGRIAFVLGVQAAGGWYSNGLDQAMASAPLGSLRALRPALRRYWEAGLRIQGLCYNTYNVFGSGCLDHTAPLSRAGRHLVEAIHEQRVLLDVAGHTGERTSFDAIEISAGRPVVCTHTNFATLNPNMRCVSDRLAETIARTGGVIGITAISDFMVRNPASAREHGPRSPRAGLDVLLDHFDHARRIVGAAHVGLGPDFLWGQAPVDVNPEDAVTFTPESLSAGPVRAVEDFEDISQLPNLVAGLRRRGWTEPELDQVLGGNWLRAYEAAWGA